MRRNFTLVGVLALLVIPLAPSSAHAVIEMPGLVGIVDRFGCDVFFSPRPQIGAMNNITARGVGGPLWTDINDGGPPGIYVTAAWDSAGRGCTGVMTAESLTARMSKRVKNNGVWGNWALEIEPDGGLPAALAQANVLKRTDVIFPFACVEADAANQIVRPTQYAADVTVLAPPDGGDATWTTVIRPDAFECIDLIGVRGNRRLNATADGVTRSTTVPWNATTSAGKTVKVCDATVRWTSKIKSSDRLDASLGLACDSRFGRIDTSLGIRLEVLSGGQWGKLGHGESVRSATASSVSAHLTGACSVLAGKTIRISAAVRGVGLSPILGIRSHVWAPARFSTPAYKLSC